MNEAKDVLDLENEQEALEMLMRVTEALVDRPTDLLIEATVTDFGTTFKASPHPDDLGKLIGKSGRMARALRVTSHSLGGTGSETAARTWSSAAPSSATASPVFGAVQIRSTLLRRASSTNWPDSIAVCSSFGW